MPPFQYNPLPEPDSIRLLLLEPSPDHSAPIQCSLVHTTLTVCKNDMIDHYTALSYVWGDPEASHNITVNGRCFKVTTNLLNALRDLRDELRVRRFWIDAICIDQSNVDERNLQVSMMGTIYGLAQHTAIYLGPSSSGIDELFKKLSFVLASEQIELAWDAFEPSATLEFVKEKILSRPWFTRVWIYQELVLSRDPWIQCGRSQMIWDEFCESVEILKLKVQLESGLEAQANRDNNQKVLEDMQHTRRKFHAAKFDKSMPHPGLIEILQSRRGFGASDPRDRIFAHLGIAAPLRQSLRYQINVDYSKSASEVYIDLAKKTILSTCSLDILRFVDTTQSQNRNVKLPSWVPDWSLPMAHDPVPSSISPTHFHHVAENNIAIISHSQFYMIWLGNSPVLTIDGFQLDVVVNVSPEIPDHVLELDPAQCVLIDTSNHFALSKEKWLMNYYKAYEIWQKKDGFQFLYPLSMDKLSQLSRELECYMAQAGQIPFTEVEHSLATLLVNHSSRQDGIHSTLTGKSVASFQTVPSKMGLVPSTTRPGDLLCQLWPESAVILRPLVPQESHDSSVAKALNQYRQSHQGHQEILELPNTLSVVHVSYIGECLLRCPVPGLDILAPFGNPRMFVIH